MINLLGENMEVNYQVNDQEIVITTDKLIAGFYMVTITNTSGKETSFKVIKQ